MRRATLALLAVLVPAAAPIFADAKLVLSNGAVLSGKSVVRKDDLFLLEWADGSIVTVPAELVKEMQLLEGKEPPTGLTFSSPRSLAGPAWAGKTPPFREQIAAFRARPYVPPLPPVDPVWRPTSGFRSNEGASALAPVRWVAAPIDPAWRPRSGFRGEAGLRPTRWFTVALDPTWEPRDSWKGTKWFTPRPPLRDTESP